ncbi:hypothetical protein ES319_A06G136000v1 [Gossypium barbadense]|uniref:Uncharacterized protein n=1 Tax=Gossypium barbadense TaxID=3634 RepID=A0A2P5XW49_GOSBA|nr:hypothetical protein ES319_A06G136000v1 [Gossypium barbadense]PPS07544.1 hypothetical protein GOBAR_AA13106 [Gossypium barbadense]
METLIFKTPIKFKISNTRISPSIFPSRERIGFRHFSRTKCFQIPGSLNVSSAKAFLSAEAEPSSYGGWDDFEPGTWSSNSGESIRLRDFLVSIRIDDKKHVFVFFSGLVCALVISRVRVSAIILILASILVFGVGFSFGFVKGGSFNDLSSNKRRSKEESSRVYSEKLRSLVDFFYGFDIKINNLKNNIQRAIDSNRINVADLENYANLVESMRLSASNAKNVVEASMDNVGNPYRENKKPSSRKKDAGEARFELLHFLGALFGEKQVASKPNKVTDTIQSESVDTDLNNKTLGDVSLPAVEDMVFNSPNNIKWVSNQGFARDSLNKSDLNRERDRKIDVDLENEKIRSDLLGGSATRSVNSEEYNYESKKLQYMNTHDISFSSSHADKRKRWKSDDNLLHSIDFSVRLEHMETEASFIHEQLHHESSRSYRFSNNQEKIENEAYGKRQHYEHDSDLADRLTTAENEVISPSSSKVVDDVVFNKYLTEASGLLKEAKECMKGRHDEERVEVILNRSASLLSQAISMKPMSLLAVGQLGNTYLLHGELKLHVSRELRTLVTKNDPITYERPQGRVVNRLDQFSCRDKIIPLLVSACEECEDLLVRAGRKYQVALSIDGDDVRSLYNWGLALSFRAQLIADIGPEAAYDADKLFLAAIDKFDVMMTRGNVHAPDAFFRLGAILQQRSRLRPGNDKEKMKLLLQAKSLYEDALHMDSKNLQVRDALSSCISELRYRYF